ncbi:MAG: hypothetical protein H7Y59_15970 [Anaerolineales bacterium]|nr:hypothetical protein [Anaerolineales bacterium]
MRNVTKLKQKGDIQGLVVVLKNKNNWMLSLDAAEALIQLEDERGLNYLINALDNPNIDIRDVAREILEGINDPKGNLSLQLRQSDSVYSDSAETSSDWAVQLKNIKDTLVFQHKKTIWNFSLEWIIASIIGMLLSDIIFGIFLYPLIFLEDIESLLITRPILAYVSSTWGEVSRKALLDIFGTVSNFRVLVMSLTIEGFLIGTAQWFVLKRYGIHIKAWVLAVICGWTLGFIVSQEASWPIASMLIDELGPHWELQIILGYTLFGLFFGTLMGLSQGIILRKYYGQKIISWLILNMLIWTFASFISEFIIDGIFWAIVGFPNYLHDGRYILNNTVMRISELTIAGTITGILLFRKFQTDVLKPFVK